MTTDISRRVPSHFAVTPFATSRSTTIMEHDDEVIADSEDEFDNSGRLQDTSAILGTSGLPGMPTAVSHISTFSTHQPEKFTSSISTTLTAVLDTHSTILPPSNIISGSEIPKSRPKPRPIKKKKDGDKGDAISSDTGNPPIDSLAFPINPMTGKPDYLAGFQPDDFPSTSSIADRAKTRQRTKPNPTSKLAEDPVFLPSDIIELNNSDDDFDELALRPSTSKNKSKRSKTKSSEPKISHASPATVTTAKPRPKPRPIAKRTPNARATPSPPPQLTPQTTHPSPAHPVPIPFRLLPSQLPPSDPPLPTSQPPIEVLQNPPTTDFFDDPLTPTSSPSSLFTPNKKSNAVDELDESDHAESFNSKAKGKNLVKGLMLPPAMLQPPPTFFAGSSCPPSPVPEDPPGIPARETRIEQDVVDLTDLPPTVPVEKPVKPKKPRKKKGEVDTGDGMDVDVDTNPGKKKKKVKTKEKGKEKEKKSPGTGQLEVTITVPPPKGKGKGKEKEKEVFKSKEFIDDSDDEAAGDVGAAADVVPTTNRPTPPPPSPPGPLPTEPPPAASDLPHVPSGSRKKRKSMAVDDSDAEELKLDSPKQKKQKGRGRSKKDNYAAALGEQVPAQGEEEVHVGTKKSGAKPKSAKGKGKLVVMSDDDFDDKAGDDDRAVAEKNAKGTVAEKSGKRNVGKKGKGKVIPDEDEDQDMAPPETGEQVHDDGGGIKENIEPVSNIIPQPVAATPKPSLFPSIASRYTIAPRTKSTPMSELIRRVNSLPGSPFPSPHPRLASATKNTPLSYSPYLKSSRSVLSRIAPLHPNRRTPPPPLPPPPPRKKTKKELEREEKWEEELVDSVGGITEWACLTDAERKELRKSKWEREMGGWDE